MRAIPHRSGWVKIAGRSVDPGPHGGTEWVEWKEIKFILVSVGLPVLVIACLAQLLPHLFRL
ncbi:MAG TPA: hypothetical protein VEK05_16710 [Burkholderiales bacterium]|nr:hypothetical protein [Burkholderiales bacterium]